LQSLTLEKLLRIESTVVRSRDSERVRERWQVGHIMLSFWNNHQITILWQNYYQRVFFPLISRVNTCTHCRVLFIENVVIDFNLYRYYLNWKCWNIPFYRFWLTLSLNKNLWIENTTKYWKYAVLERKITIFKFYIYLKLMTENFFSAILGL
jgi:hypothetical protein